MSGCWISDSNPDTVWKNIGSWLAAATWIKINPGYCLFHILWQSKGICCPRCLQRIESNTPVCICSLLHLMRAITRPTSLMHLKNSMHNFCLLHLLSGTLERENKRKNKNIKLDSWSFFFNLLKLFLTFLLKCCSSMYDFRMKENS